MSTRLRSARAPGTHWLLIGVGMGVGVTLLATAWSIDVATALQFALGEIASILIIVSLLTVIYDVGLKRDLQDILSVKQEYGHIGLVAAMRDSQEFDYGPIFENAKSLIVVVNDGRTWCSLHRDKFRRRFQDPMKETTVFLIDPTSPMLDVLSRKGSTDVASLRSRILETVQLLREVANPFTRLEILGHSLFNPQAVVLGDDVAVITPYFFSRGGRVVPALVYRDAGENSFFREIKEDLERLRTDAISLEPSDEFSLAVLQRVDTSA